MIIMVLIGGYIIHLSILCPLSSPVNFLVSTLIFFFLVSSPPLSCQDTADLQHRDEEQDEGSHYDGGSHVLEVDIGKHCGLGDRYSCLPLEHGGGFPTNQSIRSAR